MRKINSILLLWLGIAILLYTRFINLDWGFPYPFHPDERNMAIALQQLNCKEFSIFNFQFSNLRGCWNPHFFAYGQFPLYLGRALIAVYHTLTGKIGSIVTLQEAILALRLISAAASVATVFVLWKIASFFQNSKALIVASLFIFSPALIQMAHFGTTESLLALFYSLIIYLTLKLRKEKGILNSKSMPAGRQVLILNSIMCGLALATKISAALFMVIPIMTLLSRLKENKRLMFYFIFLTGVVAVIFSPHNLLSFEEFISAMRYESQVAFGLPVFYTRSFADTIPVLYQFTHIFSYALGIPILVLFILGFFLLPYTIELNIVRAAFLIYFIPSSLLYAKWTRFMAPIFPVMLIFATLAWLRLYSFGKAIIINNSKLKSQNPNPHLKTKNLLRLSCSFLFYVLSFAIIFPGIAYLSVYQNPDVRFQASEWMNKHIPKQSYVLSETANVVDLPLQGDLKTVSFNFYDVDVNRELQEELQVHLHEADYIVVPSRRIFANHEEKEYPLLSEYYKRLFSEELGFKKVAELSSYPKITLSGKTLLTFPDENAEETWTVFDHPVIRIYKK